MNINVKSKFNLYGIPSRKILLSVSLVFSIILIFSCIFFVFNNTSRVVSKISENELREAVNSATEPVVIALGGDIKLTGSLLIPAGKNITLTSSSKNGFYKLIGANGESTIIVEKNGMLCLDGITVTHNSDETGCGVEVYFGGTLIMAEGVICNNTVGVRTMPDGNTHKESGGGVLNSGKFEMRGGVIANNTAPGGGGGVLNNGGFSMSGGEISGNTAYYTGGGVYNNGYGFSMSGGEISGNTANRGGGVYNFNGKFSVNGGTIYGNNAEIGGGVDSQHGSFIMSGGVIYGNIAGDKGGGAYVNSILGNFTMYGGEISNNTAHIGGGVCFDGDFTMIDGVISGNNANAGGGLYVGNGNFRLSGGLISCNMAILGGGVWVDIEHLNRLFVSDGVVFSNNAASAAYNRDPVHDVVYNSHIDSKVTWTKLFHQGYNNYDISYTVGSSYTPEPIMNSELYGVGCCGYLVLVVAFLILIVGIVAVVLFFYFQKRGKLCRGKIVMS